MGRNRPESPRITHQDLLILHRECKRLAEKKNARGPDACNRLSEKFRRAIAQAQDSRELVSLQTLTDPEEYCPPGQSRHPICPSRLVGHLARAIKQRQATEKNATRRPARNHLRYVSVR